VKPRHATTGPQPVFADSRGRRRVIIRWLAIGAGAIISGFVVVAAVGLLGGPQVPVLPWPHQHAGRASLGDPGTGSPPGAAATTGAGLPARGGAAASQSPNPAPQVSPTVSPSSVVATTTNRAGKTPPGQNRTQSPSPHRTRPA
jgi:hypothetical protein